MMLLSQKLLTCTRSATNVLEESYSLEFADMLYKPDVELAKRDYQYYQRKGEEQSYGRHNERSF